MLSKADKLLEYFDDTSFLPFTPNDIKKAFQSKLAYHDFDNVIVSEVDIDLEGDIIVTFEDFEGDEVSILFQVDQEDDSIEAVVLDDEDDFESEDAEVLLVDLTSLNPSVLDVESLGLKYVNLTDLSWLNKSAFASLLQAGDVGIEADEPHPSQEKQDAYGNRLAQDKGVAESLDERTAIVVRGGKRQKLAVVRRKRKKRLTSAQRQGIRKGALKRKSKKAQIQRKRKRSLSLRKRTGLKRAKSGSRKLWKVRGT